jgi:hypothetical protein
MKRRIKKILTLMLSLAVLAATWYLLQKEVPDASASTSVQGAVHDSIRIERIN